MYTHPVWKISTIYFSAQLVPLHGGTDEDSSTTAGSGERGSDAVI